MKNYLKLVIIVLGVTAAVFQMVSIYVSGRETLNSVDATKVKRELEALEEQNMELESRLLTMASYTAISSRAGELGYVDNKEFVSLYDPVQVAIGR